MLLTLSKCQPSVRKEVVQVTHIGIWEASEDILEILEGVDFESLTGLHEAHENRGSMAALQRASKQPVRSAKNNWLNRTLAGIVGDIDLAGVGVEAECIPALEGVGDSIGELGFRGFFVKVFIEPEFEKSKFWFGQSLSHIFALFFGKLLRDALNVKETFDYSHGEFDRDLVVKPSIFKAAVNMRPAVGGSSTCFDYAIEFVGAVREKNPLKALENFLGIHGVFCFREIVYHIRIGIVTEHGPDYASMSLAETFLDDRHCCGISQYQSTLRDEYFHSLNDGFQKICTCLEPATHGGPVDGQTESLEDFLLAVERQVEEEFVGNDLCKQPWTSFSFVDWLVWLVRREDMLAAILATVLVDDVADLFKDRLHEIGLSGDIKAKDSSLVAAAGACELGWVTDGMLLVAMLNGALGGRRSTAALVVGFDDIEISFFSLKLHFCLRVNSFAGAGKEGGIYLGGLLPECSTFTPTELFLKCSDAGEKLSNETVAIRDIVRQFVRFSRSAVRGLFGHFFVLCFRVTILYSMHQ